MPSLINATTTNGLVTSADNSGSLQLQTNNGTTAVTIDTGQNVGIGTTSPQTKLHVSDAVAGGQLLVTTNETNSTSKIGSLATMHYTNSQAPVLAISVEGAASDNIVQVGGGPGEFNASTQVRFFTAANNTTTGGTERMRITSGGELLIGRTSTLNARLGILSSSGACSINCGDEADPSDYGMIQIVRNANQPDNKFHLAFIRGGNKIAGMGFLDNSDTLAIQNASNNAGAGVTLTNAATSWGTTSDERKKDIIAPVEDALTKLADWRSVYYKYKNDEADAPQRVGLIAQDVQATLPESISVESDEMQTLQLRYTETIPLLVKAIQELKAELDATKAEVQALKGVA